MPTLENLLERLVRHRVEFVVVGGFAATAHGCSLLTEDVDICLEFTAENLARLHDALADLHPCHRMTPARLPFEPPGQKPTIFKNLYLETNWGQLDCLGKIDGVGSYVDALAESDALELPAGTCHVLTIEALIRAKAAMGRPRDREAVLQLQAIRQQRDDEGPNPPEAPSTGH